MPNLFNTTYTFPFITINLSILLHFITLLSPNPRKFVTLNSLQRTTHISSSNHVLGINNLSQRRHHQAKNKRKGKNSFSLNPSFVSLYMLVLDVVDV